MLFQENQGKSRNQRKPQTTRNPQVNQTIIVHHFPNTTGPSHPATQRPTAREVLMQGQPGTRRMVTTSQPNVVQMPQQHPQPAVVYPMHRYPVQQYPQPLAAYPPPPPHVAPAPQMQIVPQPLAVGYHNPAFAPDWQALNPHIMHNHRTFRSPWH